MPMILTREAILAADDLPRQRVDVPEWGGAVTVRSMTASERDAWETSLIAGDGERNMENARARLVSLCVVDEDGKRLFTDDDALLLGQKAASAVDRVFQAAVKLNRLSRQEVAALAGE